MTSRFPPSTPDHLVIPAFLVHDENSPEFQQWCCDHPDRFVAGT